MNTIYVITGPAGVGKTTISNKLAESLEKSALIEGDDIYHFVKVGYVSPWKEGNHLDIFWKNSISLIDNFMKNGYDVVYNYIIEKDKLEKIRDSFPDSKIKFILLVADKDTLIKRDKERPEDCQMGERVLVLLNELLTENFDNKNILDTTNLTIEEVVNEIKNNDNYVI